MNYMQYKKIFIFNFYGILRKTVYEFAPKKTLIKTRIMVFGYEN